MHLSGYIKFSVAYVYIYIHVYTDASINTVHIMYINYAAKPCPKFCVQICAT